MIIVEGRDYVMFDVLLSLSPDAKEWTGLKPKIAEIKDKDKYFISSISKRKSKLTGKKPSNNCKPTNHFRFFEI